jgi:hypothetical protein
MSCISPLGLILALVLSTACTIERAYMGNEFAGPPDGRIVVGQTTKREILELLGPPDRIQRQYDGDVFVYAYCAELPTTRSGTRDHQPDAFTYQKSQEKATACGALRSWRVLTGSDSDAARAARAF